MNRLRSWISNYWPLLALLAIELLLFTTNYTPNTFVVGWDNMYPEFNFWLNIKRAFFGVWQEYRGLGLEDGLSHAAQLPHYIFLWIMSFVLPQHLLRYMFIFLMHLVGGIGMYTLLHTSVFKHPKSFQNSLIALAGALFYQYNFATVQMFYLPFEVFMVHFAFLPWLVWAIMKYLHHGTKKNALGFALLSLISTPQAHVPTVFLVYLMVVGIILLTHIATQRSRVAIQRAGILIVLIFCTNAFWGLPFAHNTITHARDIANSKNNQIATNDIFLKNQRYGDLKNTALMRSFSLDYVQYDHTTKLQSFMFTPWKQFIDTPIPALAGGIFFSLAIIGGILIVSSKRMDLYIYLMLFMFSFCIIGNDIPYISLFSQFLRDHIPLFANVFRFVFTKFFTLYAFAYAILISHALLELSHSSPRARKRESIIVFLIFVGALGWYTFPSFQGNFFFKNLRVAIPKDYMDTFQFFSSQPLNKRIAILPAPWFWAWTQYDWGVIGSGFQWFGFQQPTMDRAFDPWSRMNENFYWELSQALYTKNAQQIRSVFTKHDISYILLDEHIINGSDSRALYADEIASWIATDPTITKLFTSGKITVYSLDATDSQDSFVSLKSGLVNIGPASTWNDYDAAFPHFGTYVIDPSAPYDVVFPFRSLFSGRSQHDLEFSAKDMGTAVRLEGAYPRSTLPYILTLPAIDALQIQATNSAEKMNMLGRLPIISVGNLFSGTQQATSQDVSFIGNSESTTDITIPKNQETIVYDTNRTRDLQQPAKSCDGYLVGSMTHLSNPVEHYERLTSENSSNCIAIDLSNISQRYGYLVSIEHRPVEGKVLAFSLTNKDSRRSFIETVLTPVRQRDPGDASFETAWITVPPLEYYGLGYTMTIDNVSIGREKSVNDIRRIQIYKIPYELLTSLQFVSNTYEIASPAKRDRNDPSASSLLRSLNVKTSEGQAGQALQVEHPNGAYYRITLIGNREPLSGKEVLVLSQSFDEGWRAYTINTNNPIIKYSNNPMKNWLFEMLPFVFGTEIKEHVLVNNWANAWRLPSELVSKTSELSNVELSRTREISSIESSKTSSLEHSDTTDLNREATQNEATIILFFWPQVLEWLGFVLLPFPFVWILRRNE